MSFPEYYWARLEQPSQFAVITDAGTPMERLGRELGFRGLFLNRTDIGGRYSAISMVGLVPAAILGIDLRRLLAGAQAMADACGPGGADRGEPRRASARSSVGRRATVATS
jgi:glucose-6-phosphate isomerase/transaldolase/glucose-6-phosphate isomerase